jgi:hypothetical protein
MKRQSVETVDGRVYFSDDGWQTVYLTQGTSTRKIVGHAADLARFLWAMKR